MDNALAFPDFVLSWLPGPLLGLTFVVLTKAAYPSMGQQVRHGANALELSCLTRSIEEEIPFLLH